MTLMDNTPQTIAASGNTIESVVETFDGALKTALSGVATWQIVSTNMVFANGQFHIAAVVITVRDANAKPERTTGDPWQENKSWVDNT